MAYPVPQKSKQQDATILTYELPDRIHSTCAYPLQAPNGSSVVLYAHNAGISVIWRGGQPLKASSQDGISSQQEGAANEDGNAMMIDLDESLHTATTPGKKTNTDANQDVPAAVIAHTTIEMDVTPLHLSVPPLVELDDISGVHYALTYCEDNIVVAAVCADGSVRLLSLPSRPTSNERQQASQELIVYSDDNAFRTPRGLSLSFTSHSPTSYNSNGYQLGNQTVRQDDEWDFLVAWHVSEPVAALSVAAVSLDKIITGYRFGRPRRQTYPLSAPLTSLSFNPAARHFSRHKQLLAADVEGLVRICSLKFVPKTSPTGGTQHELARWPNWTGTFYVPFASNQSGNQKTATPSRKKILGAEWALDGRCAIVLLQDASWGLWDFEGARPELPGSRQVASTGTGVHGGGVTNFALRGNLESKSRSANDSPAQTEPTRQLSAAEKRLAPMTPNTRKAKQNVFLDKAPNRKPDNSIISTATAGGVSVSRPARAVASAPYETIVFWHNESVYTIPNLMLYWQRAVQVAGGVAATAPVGGTVNGPSPIHLAELSTLGEPITSIAQLPAFADESLSSQQRLEHDFVVAAEHRQVFVCPPRPQLASRNGFQPPKIARGAAGATQSNGGPARSTHDEQLLANGQLGLAGLDRVMDGMDSSDATNLNLFGQPQRPRRVGFARGP